MNLETNTAKAMRYSVWVGMIVMVAGLLLYLICSEVTLLKTGVLLLILSPVVGILVTTTSLILVNDRRWTAVALMLLLTTIIGILIEILIL